MFFFVEGLKSEPVLDINELKTMGLTEKIKLGKQYQFYWKKLKIKMEKYWYQQANSKIKGWDKLVEAYEKNEPIMGKITSKCKGGCIVEHIEPIIDVFRITNK